MLSLNLRDEVSTSIIFHIGEILFWSTLPALIRNRKNFKDTACTKFLKKSLPIVPWKSYFRVFGFSRSNYGRWTKLRYYNVTIFSKCRGFVVYQCSLMCIDVYLKDKGKTTLVMKNCRAQQNLFFSFSFTTP